jgi:hypothetical protein
MSEAEAAAERKRMLDLRAVLRKLEPDIRRHSALFDSGAVKTQKDDDKLRYLVLRAIGLGLADPLVQRLCRTADFRGDRHDGCPSRRVLRLMIQHHTHRSGTNLG